MTDHLKTVRLVRADPENATILANISRRAFHTAMACGSPYDKPGGPPGYDSPKAHLRFMWDCHYYEIHYRRKLVGAVMVVERAPDHCECTGLFVDPKVQNKGVATRAFELLWERYPKARRWTVNTQAWDLRTNHFYPKLGFQKVGDDGQGGVWYERAVAE